MKENVLFDDDGQPMNSIIDHGGWVELDMYLTYLEEWQAMEHAFALLRLDADGPVLMGPDLPALRQISALSMNRAGVVEARFQITWAQATGPLSGPSLAQAIASLSHFLGAQAVFIADDDVQLPLAQAVFTAARAPVIPDFKGVLAQAQMTSYSSIPGSPTEARLANCLARASQHATGFDALHASLDLLLAAREDAEHFHYQRIARTAVTPENGHVLDADNGVVLCRFCQRYHPLVSVSDQGDT